MQLTVDPRRADRERRYKPPPASSAPAEDLTTDYMNILGKNIHSIKTSYKILTYIRFAVAISITLIVYLIFSRQGMVFSMCGLMMRLKWCAWTAIFCSSISFANSRVSDDTKQIVSSFMLSLSAVVMSYLQNPSPMSPPWASLTT